MVEPVDNIQLVCKTCADQAKNLFQNKIRKDTIMFLTELDLALDDDSDDEVFLKFDFTEEINGEVEHEHMWLSITSVDLENTSVTGLLANQPVLITNVKEGDTIIRSIYDAEDIY